MVILEDADGDDVCDGDEIPGCTSSTALNYNPIATDDNGTCQEPVGGCTNPEACNFDVLATNDDGTCEFESCAGCLQEAACNYDATALYADDSCEFPPFGYDCDGNCLMDEDGDGVCDPFEIAGCQDLAACNYDPAATDPGLCNYATPNFDCDGNSLRPIFTRIPSQCYGSRMAGASGGRRRGGSSGIPICAWLRGHVQRQPLLRRVRCASHLVRWRNSD